MPPCRHRGMISFYPTAARLSRGGQAPRIPDRRLQSPPPQKPEKGKAVGIGNGTSRNRRPPAGHCAGRIAASPTRKRLRFSGTPRFCFKKGDRRSCRHVIFAAVRPLPPPGQTVRKSAVCFSAGLHPKGNYAILKPKQRKTKKTAHRPLCRGGSRSH